MIIPDKNYQILKMSVKSMFYSCRLILLGDNMQKAFVYPILKDYLSIGFKQSHQKINSTDMW